MNIPNDLLYAKSHEWLRLEKDSGTVGITDHAQSELSDVVYVELPKIGRKVAAGERQGRLRYLCPGQRGNYCGQPRPLLGSRSREPGALRPRLAFPA